MGYTAYLQKLLRPLGVYDLESSSASGGELAALGEAMDTFFSHAQILQQEGLPVTASGEGLLFWEQLLPLPAPEGSVELRRQRILGLCALGGQGLSAAALEATLAACGVECRVEEELETRSAIISFPGVTGEPPQFEDKKRVIESVLPCHLSVCYRFF